MVRVLVTGGAGFIGSNFVKTLLSDRKYEVIVLDKLTYAGNLDNFSEKIRHDPRFIFVKGDIALRKNVYQAIKKVDKIVHFAAETHIDRSVVNIDPFVRTDFVGTYVLLEEFRMNPCDRFIHISTSEVYGSAQTVPMAEDHPIAPQSPYAATKAGADRLVHSYYKTYNLPLVIIRPFNNYGPNQYPEKLIPFFTTNALEDKPLFVYGSGQNTRDWLYVKDCCEAIKKILEVDINKVKGEVINLGSGSEVAVLEIADLILKYFNKPKSLIRHIKDRPAHVERLISSTDKAKKLLGWKPATDFKTGIRQTIAWYQNNPAWWQKIRKRKEYQRFYREWYEKLLA
ncbi:MAG: dTDP-glucose 4,6-dehydratase [candidate division WOR-3 bacterium]|nr:dTDP-glucose 4,6-dehydratase [candidate division WOR-3 bacterium]